MTGRFGSVVVVGFFAASALPVACGGDANSSDPTGGSHGGSAGTTGGSHADGGARLAGGTPATGGSVVTGGQPSPTGGAATTGGATPTGGVAATGGASVTGGAGPTGGVSTTGGTIATGGNAQGGASDGGRDSEGGQDTAGSGGEPGTGGVGGGTVACSQTRSSRSARSAGFSGSYQTNYYPLYSTGCVTPADCASACTTAGGTSTSCAASECVDSTPDYCLPPTYWFDFDRLLVEASSEESSAWIIMVNNPYRDTLLASNFQFELPTGATVVGVRFSLNESADSENMIGDYSVKALKGGSASGLDRGKTTAWAPGFHYVDYGGPNDLWGLTWTPADINSSQFGVSLTPLYLDTAGNARAYVDFIKATVYYNAPSCN